MRRMLVAVLLVMLVVFAGIFLLSMLVEAGGSLFGVGLPPMVERFVIMAFSLAGILYSLYELVGM